MDVHVRNVPQQTTDNGFKRFMKPQFEKLCIRAVNCHKLAGKTFATITFLHIPDAERFLAQHGQARLPPGTRQRGQNSGAMISLSLHNQRIYFEKSDRKANPYHLRVLAKEEEDRLTKLEDPIGAAQVSDVLPISFECASVSCGVWSYAKSDLVFAPQLVCRTKAKAKFSQRSMILTTDLNQRIDFRYLGIDAITVEDGGLIISMREPPQFYENIIDPVEKLLAALRIDGHNGSAHMQRRTGPDRHRISFLDEEHKEIAGNCLVYRVELVKSEQSSDHEKVQSLQKARGLPPILFRYTKIVLWPETYIVGLRRLHNTLFSSNTTISFALKFQIQKLVQNNYLTPAVVIKLIPTLIEMTKRSGVRACVDTVRKLFSQIPYPSPDIESRVFEVDTLIDNLRRIEESTRGDEASLEAAQRSGNVAIIHRAKVTPSHVFLYGPEPETTNRVLRHYAEYHDYFLRVQFCDEDGMPVRFNSRVSNENIFRGRFEDILHNGIQIAGPPFIDNKTGSLVWNRIIIRELGKFEAIRSPAKCAARIGQTFSDTPITVKIDPAVCRTVNDIERNERVFSDGVGAMSISLMHKIWDKLSQASLAKPTCFQIRYAGAKGMISLDTRLKGDALVLRPSMIKFEGFNKTDIEICESAYKPLPAYLNRQFIKILEDMGVPDSFFLNLQAKEVDRLRMMTNNPTNASTFLKRQSIGEGIHLPWLFMKLTSMRLSFYTDPFLRNVLEIALLVELRALKYKTRIPVEKGYHLHGVIDETNTLAEGQIYCTVRESGVNRAITGKRMIISRAPALHPGDVQVVEGVDVPRASPLAALSNCVVFSQKGDRDLPSKLSGGDLDGDRYHIIWDEACQPVRQFSPADYPRIDPVDIGRSVELQDMTDFFIKFMETDQLGRIAVLHRVLADQKEEGTLDNNCLILAEMHSTAVDYSKTGIPVDMTKLPKYSPWRPDFEAPGPYVTIAAKDGINFDAPSSRDADAIGDDDDDFANYRYYKSDKILGKLYRAIDERKLFEEIKQRSAASAINSRNPSTLINAVWRYVQSTARLIQWQHKRDWARDLRDEYEECVWNIMTEYSDHPSRPLSELEVFIGNILGRTGAQSKRQRELSTTLKEKFEDDSTFFVKCIVKDGDEWSKESLERSIACLAVSLEEQRGNWRGEPLQSFKYVAAAVCLREVERMVIV